MDVNDGYNPIDIYEPKCSNSIIPNKEFVIT